MAFKHVSNETIMTLITRTIVIIKPHNSPFVLRPNTKQ